MSADRRLRVSKQADHIVFAVFQDAAKEFAATAFSISVISVGSINVLDQNESVKIKSLSKSKGYVISNISLSLGAVTVYFRRALTNVNGHQETSAFFDEIEFPSNNAPLDDIIKLSELFSKRLVATNFNLSDVELTKSSSKDQIFQIYSSTAQQLQDSVSQIQNDLTQTRINLEQEYQKKRETAEEQFQSKILEAEESAKSRQINLDEIESNLKKRADELDDSDHTHARRKKQEELRAKIVSRSQNFRVTPETIGTRRPIHIACFVGLILLALMNYYFVSNFTEYIAAATPAGNVAVTLVFAKQFGLTIAFLGLLAYYIRWLNRWSEKYATTEFGIKQFELDIDRASWAVETMLEWKAEKLSSEEFPDSLLQGISRNLFSQPDQSNQEEMHPADYLASALLGTARGIKLSIAGNEIELDPKKIRKDLST
jgi:hypothetical protein